MKNIHFTTLIFLLAALTLSIGCNSKKADPAIPETVSPVVSATPQEQTTVPAPSGDNMVQHFTCPNKCKGSGGPVEGKCPVCGTDYVHNDAFHKGSSIPEPAMKIDPATNMAVPTHTEAQNAKGEYHFTCPNGHPGAGAAGTCAKCGATLAHNAAFHSN
ncbi:MAG TPA: hypothetical protein VFG10_11325 [Saprospiraceae bacterium]|nr:hypothetical protein [Saprospiraceae bacterium]